MKLNTFFVDKSKQLLKNPFLRLDYFRSRNSDLFAGREIEIQQLVEKIVGRKIVILIGESGVGKTSIVEAGVVPKLRDYRYRTVHFQFQGNPIQSMVNALRSLAQPRLKKKEGQFKNKKINYLKIDILKEVQNVLKKKQKTISRLLIIGDHLEQMFTIKKTNKTRMQFTEQIARILGSNLPITLLFCIREDYLPDLYELSQDIPELYDRDNTYRLQRLSEEKGKDVLRRASERARIKMSKALIEKIAHDLCYEGEGMIYPPYIQIVGFTLYMALNRRRGIDFRQNEISVSLYERLGRIETIVNRYFDSLLDLYSQKDKPIVGQILKTMVTDYYTKKRISRKDLQEILSFCHNLDRLLASLVQNRIVRRTLGEYELIHDFLVRRVIEVIEKKTFLSASVRKALDFIENNYMKADLTSKKIASSSGLSQMHLAKLFKGQLNSTMNNQLNTIRIANAKKIMLKNRLPLQVVAKRVGFNTLSSFSRKFMDMEDIRPLAFRKMMIVKQRNVK